MEGRNGLAVKLMTKSGSKAKTRPMTKFLSTPAFLPNIVHDLQRRIFCSTSFQGYTSLSLVLFRKRKIRILTHKVYTGNKRSADKGT